VASVTDAAAEHSPPGLTVRDPYVFEFLGLTPREVMTESHLEDQLLDRLQAFLLELGQGFCFEARQRRILIGDTYNFVDLVFYHRILKCHVLVELKLEAFSHENIGQLNTYVSWYDRHVRTSGDNRRSASCSARRRTTRWSSTRWPAWTKDGDLAMFTRRLDLSDLLKEVEAGSDIPEIEEGPRDL
jgi:hypothetical protein